MGQIGIFRPPIHVFKKVATSKNPLFCGCPVISSCAPSCRLAVFRCRTACLQGRSCVRGAYRCRSACTVAYGRMASTSATSATTALAATRPAQIHRTAPAPTAAAVAEVQHPDAEAGCSHTAARPARCVLSVQGARLLPAGSHRRPGQGDPCRGQALQHVLGPARRAEVRGGVRPRLRRLGMVRLPGRRSLLVPGLQPSPDQAPSPSPTLTLNQVPGDVREVLRRVPRHW